MDHERVVKLFDYTETNKEYVLFMEFCDNPDYLSSKILEVSFSIYLMFYEFNK